MRKAKQKFCASHVTHRNALASQMKKRDKKERDDWTAINKLKDPFRVGEEVEKFAKLCEEHDATGKGVQRPEFSLFQQSRTTSKSNFANEGTVGEWMEQEEYYAWFKSHKLHLPAEIAVRNWTSWTNNDAIVKRYDGELRLDGSRGCRICCPTKDYVDMGSGRSMTEAYEEKTKEGKKEPQPSDLKTITESLGMELPMFTANLWKQSAGSSSLGESAREQLQTMLMASASASKSPVKREQMYEDADRGVEPEKKKGNRGKPVAYDADVSRLALQNGASVELKSHITAVNRVVKLAVDMLQAGTGDADKLREMLVNRLCVARHWLQDGESEDEATKSVEMEGGESMVDAVQKRPFANAESLKSIDDLKAMANALGTDATTEETMKIAQREWQDTLGIITNMTTAIRTAMGLVKAGLKKAATEAKKQERVQEADQKKREREQTSAVAASQADKRAKANNTDEVKATDLFTAKLGDLPNFKEIEVVEASSVDGSPTDLGKVVIWKCCDALKGLWEHEKLAGFREEFKRRYSEAGQYKMYGRAVKTSDDLDFMKDEVLKLLSPKECEGEAALFKGKADAPKDSIGDKGLTAGQAFVYHPTLTQCGPETRRLGSFRFGVEGVRTVILISTTGLTKLVKDSGINVTATHMRSYLESLSQKDVHSLAAGAADFRFGVLAAGDALYVPLGWYVLERVENNSIYMGVRFGLAWADQGVLGELGAMTALHKTKVAVMDPKQKDLCAELDEIHASLSASLKEAAVAVDAS